MKAKLLSLIAGALMLGAGSASAVTISFSNAQTGPSGTFNIVGVGYTPGDIIDSVKVDFTLLDLTSTSNAFTIQLGAVSFPFTDFVTAAVVTFSTIDPAILIDLQDGEIGYNVITSSPSTVVVVGEVEALVTVPDGGATVALLGMGLCGLAGLKSRFARK